MRSREQILASRWIKPFAHRLTHPSLWHINRRSLSKAIGLGLFAAFMVPIGQVVLAALLAIPFRANVPIAAGATFVTNPLTTGPIFVAAYFVGAAILGAFGVVSPELGDVSGSYASTALHVIGPVTLGMIVFSVSAGLAGYALSRLWIRLRLTMRWRGRRAASLPVFPLNT